MILPLAARAVGRGIDRVESASPKLLKFRSWMQARSPNQSLALLVADEVCVYGFYGYLYWQNPLLGFAIQTAARPVRWPLRGYLLYRLGPNMAKSNSYMRARQLYRIARVRIKRRLRPLRKKLRTLAPQPASATP
jgi:hypothetical protein